MYFNTNIVKRKTFLTELSNMKIAGIVSEYNPFHMGHEYHIKKTREMLGDCVIICVMSGDFVQRGETALFSKYSRAEAACMCGADIVIELPLPWSLSSAEGFARGAVGLLADIGAEYISFGSETGDVDSIEKTADILSREDSIELIKNILKKEPEMSFAAAREKAIRNLAGEDCTKIISGANDSLAVEYLRAIKKLGADISPIAVKREGNGHDGFGASGFLSASEIRRLFYEGKDVSCYLPEEAAKIFADEINAGRVINKELFETAVLARLRALDENYFLSLPDSNDGIGNRLYRESRKCASLDELYNAAKTKKYAMSRVRRISMCALLGIKSGMNDGKAPYARILAASANGCRALRKISDEKKIPLITKPADINKYDNKLQQLFAIGVYAHDVYSLCYENKSERIGSREWQISPKIVKNE